MARILLDTNFILIPAQFRVDIYSEICRVVDGKPELCTLSSCMDELEKIKGRGGRKKAQAKLSIELLKHHRVKVITAKESYPDKELLDYSDKGYWIATQDIELKKKLREKKAKVITMRNRSYLASG